MAQKGIWQLKKLLVIYCDLSGSSAGARYIWLMTEQQLGCPPKHICPVLQSICEGGPA